MQLRSQYFVLSTLGSREVGKRKNNLDVVNTLNLEPLTRIWPYLQLGKEGPSGTKRVRLG